MRDGDSLIAELDGTNAMVTAYTNGPTGMVSQRRNNATKFHLFDALGSTQQLTDSTQTVTDNYSYDAYGNITSQGGTSVNPAKYVGSQGYYADGDSGLQLLGHRYYDPTTGRFITLDPVKDGLNWYVYCANNPVNAADPTGEAPPLSTCTTPAGYATMACMAQEEMQANNCPITETPAWNGCSEWVYHHIFPVGNGLKDKFCQIFDKNFINNMTLKCPEWFNKWVHSGCDQGGWWNKQWLDFFKNCPKPTPQQVLDQGRLMMNECGLTATKWCDLMKTPNPR